MYIFFLFIKYKFITNYNNSKIIFNSYAVINSLFNSLFLIFTFYTILLGNLVTKIYYK